MKKFLLLITTLLCVLCGALAFAACGETTTGNTGSSGTQTEQPGGTNPGGSQTEQPGGEEKPHVHSFANYVYNDDATCTEDGTETATCSCGEKDTRTKKNSALGHSFQVYTSNEDATCTENGTETATCTRCSEQDTREVKDSALGHDWDDGQITTPATCTSAGVKTFTCNHDPDHHKTERIEIDPSAHKYGDWVDRVDAECEKDGVLGHFECEYCHENFDEKYAHLDSLQIEQLGHEWDSGVVTPATCTTPGQTYYTCQRNADHHKTEEIKVDPKAHGYGDWIPQIDAECEKDGVLGHFECEYCHENFDSQYAHLDSLKIEKLNHDWDSGVVTPATCTTPGQTYYTCHHNPEHHKTEKIEIDPKAHGYGDWIPQIDAKCTEEGMLGHFQCEYCQQYFDSDYEPLDNLTINKLDHQYGEWQDEIPTSCTAPGRRGYQECESCHLKYDREGVLIEEDDLTIEQLAHDYRLKHMRHRTCISHAAFVFTCNKCGGTYEDEIPDIDLSVEMTSISLSSTVQKSYHINLTGGYGQMQLKIHVEVINSPNVSLSGSGSGLDFKISHSGSWNSTDECILTITCSDEYGNITTAKFSLAAGMSVPVGLSRLEQTVLPAHGWQPKGEGTPYTHTLQCRYCEEETAEAHTSEDGGRTCSVCGKTVDHSLGLSYTLNGDGTAYTVTGMGSSTDTELVIPEQYGVADGELLPVTAIARSAFEWWNTLTSVVIPNSVTSIGYYAFQNCNHLESITIPTEPFAEGEYFHFYDLFGYRSDSVPASLKTVIITGETSIGYSAFADCSGLESVTIGNGVTSIGERAFYNCSGLESVTIGNGVTSIGYSAFKNCSNLWSVVWNAENCTETGSYNGYNDLVFNGCTNLSCVTFGENVKTIPDYAFQNCSELISIKIPDSVTWIGKCAFQGCSGLNSVTIGNGVTSIGNYAFRNCSELISIKIPDGVTSIGSSAFEGCSGLESVTIGNGVTSIGDYAFQNCSGLISIKIPDGVTSIGNRAFDECSGLESVTIGNGVTSIGERAFYNCSGLESVTIGNGVTSIGNYAFQNCSGLISIIIPDSVTTIGYYAFADCSGLESVTIGSGVTSIGNWQFSGCSGLNSVTIGSGVTSIGNYAFRGCSGLQNIIWNAENCAEAGSSFTPIFKDCTNLSSVTFGENVKTIPAYVFYMCSGLTGELKIPDSVTSIGAQAFYGCSGLTGELKIPDSVTSIGEWAFNGCSGLTGELKIPDSVTSIGEWAFYNCSGLESVTIGNGVATMGQYAFSGCKNLQSVTFRDPYGWRCGSSTVDPAVLQEPASAAQYLTAHVYAAWTKETSN